MNHILKEDEDTLAHYGVKGMKWGVRKDRKGTPRPKKPRRSSRRAQARQLSEAQLVEKIRRLRLEEEFVRLSTPKKTAGRKFVEEVATDVGKQQLKRLINGSINVSTGMAFDKLAKSSGADSATKSFLEAMAKTSNISKKNKS